MGKDIYDRRYFEGYENDPKREEMYRQELLRVLRITKLKSGNILDVGCGLGNFLEIFPRRFRKYGVEVSKYARGVAEKRGINFSFPKKPNLFDLVIYRGTIQHLDTPLSDIKNRLFQLKPGGWIVFLATPNAGSLYYRLWQDLPMIDPKYNFVIFSDQQLANILELFGLRVKKIIYPYKETPYANPLFDLPRFVLKLLGLPVKFAFPGNMMEIYAQKVPTNPLR